MRLPTNQLINKIGSLSSELSQPQLKEFLDIIDAMTALVEEASELNVGVKKASSLVNSQVATVGTTIIH